MASLGEQLYSRLSTNSAVAALVGNRIYPGLSPENLYPLVTYEIEDETPVLLSSSPLTGVFKVTVTIEALSYAAAQAVAAAVTNALDGQRWGTVSVCTQTSSTDSVAGDAGGNSEVIYWAAEQSYTILAAF